MVIRRLAHNIAIDRLSGRDPGYGRPVAMISVRHTRTSKLNKELYYNNRTKYNTARETVQINITGET
jgi:hypothetical protein